MQPLGGRRLGLKDRGLCRRRRFVTGRRARAGPRVAALRFFFTGVVDPSSLSGVFLRFSDSSLSVAMLLSVAVVVLAGARLALPEGSALVVLAAFNEEDWGRKALT